MATNTAPSFVHYGTVDTNIADNVLAIQQDGKILVTGRNALGLLIARYNSDGSLDQQFTNNEAISDFAGNHLATSHLKIIQQPDGKIIVVSGIDFISSGDTYINYGLLLVRYNSDGSLDSDFGVEGKTFIGINGFVDTINILLHPDGKIITVTSDYQYSFSNQINYFTIANFLSNGSLNNAFNGNGKLTGTSSYPNSFAVFDASLQSDGKMIFTGVVNKNLILKRYNPDGSLDNEFNENGNVIVDFNGDDIGRDIVLQTDNKILVVGTSLSLVNTDFLSPYQRYTNSLILLRYNLDGSLDNTFDSDGKVNTIINVSEYSQIDNVIAKVLPNGKIFVASTANNDYLVLTCYLGDGRLDTSYGTDGQIMTKLPPEKEFSSFINHRINFQEDNKILVSYQGSFKTLARYNMDGNLDKTFNYYNSVENTIAVQENKAIVISPKAEISDAELDFINSTIYSFGNYNGANLILMRQGGANANDLFDTEKLSGIYAGSLLSIILENSNVSVNNVIIGTYEQTEGKLIVNFNNNANAIRVNQFISHITYTNTADQPPASVNIDWIFSDGDAVNPLSTVGTTTIEITPVDDTPTGHAKINGIFTVGNTLTASNNLADADGLGTISYQWQTSNDGANWNTVTTADQLLLSPSLLNQQLKLVASYTDEGGTSNNSAHILGTPNDDRLNSSVGNDILNGSLGKDWAVYANAVSSVSINLKLSTAQNTKGAGLDTLVNIEHILGSPFNDTLIGNSLANGLYGGNGNDVLNGGLGDDILSGGNGIDWAYYSGVASSVTVDLNLTVPQNTQGAGKDVLKSIENIAGSAFNDMLIGNTLNNTLYGGSGNDILNGGGGNDTLSGDVGNDTLNGGDGVDTVQYKNATRGVLIDLNNFGVQNTYGEGSDTLIDIENVIGSNFGDDLVGNAQNNVLNGWHGNDSLYGNYGNDILISDGQLVDDLYGGGGIDWAYFNNSSTGIVIYLDLNTQYNTWNKSAFLQDIENVLGSNYDDKLIGDLVNNQLHGSQGNDSLSGGLGNDILLGGLGNDIFVFDTKIGADNIDKIIDFSIQDDTIKLNKTIFTSFSFSGDLDKTAFKILGNGGVADADDRILYNTMTGQLYYDADGNGAGSSFQIALLGKGLALTASDFLVV